MMELGNLTRDTWVAMEIWDQQAGACIAREAFPICRLSNRPWWKLVNIFAVRILHIGSKDNARSYVAPARLAAHSGQDNLITKPVRCSNGQDYASAAVACAELGIDRSNMRKHLRGLPGYRTVKGLQFMCITLDDMGESR